MRSQGFILLWTLTIIGLLLSSTLWLTHGLGSVSKISQAAQGRFEAQQSLVKAHHQYVKLGIQGFISPHQILNRKRGSPKHKFTCLGLKTCRMHQEGQQCWVWSVLSQASYGFNSEGKVTLSAHYESPALSEKEHVSCWEHIRRSNQFKLLYWLE